MFFLEGCEKEQGSLYGLEPTNPDVPGHPGHNNALLHCNVTILQCNAGSNVTILQCITLNAGSNVPDIVAFRSAGPDDCAAKCSRVAGCKAWTLHKR